MVFQNYALFPHMTVFENVAFPLRMRGAASGDVRERVRYILELVQLLEYEERFPNQLSGGQQQRVALARALVFDPQLLLLDEPMGALDRKLRQAMQLELKHLQQRLGITVIHVTHDQEEALIMSNRIAVMNQGLIEQVGTPEELYDRPATRFVASFIGETNFLSGRILQVAGGICELEVSESLVVEGRATAHLADAQRAHAVIRPERIWFVKGGETLKNHCDGEVIETIYSGEMVRYVVKVGTDTLILVKQQNRSDLVRPERGEKVRMGWGANDTAIFR
jgi:ABC-type Fe3+/spermidine/putrescine transport system ATPase subunit